MARAILLCKSSVLKKKKKQTQEQNKTHAHTQKTTPMALICLSYSGFHYV